MSACESVTTGDTQQAGLVRTHTSRATKPAPRTISLPLTSEYREHWTRKSNAQQQLRASLTKEQVLQGGIVGNLGEQACT
jgi:hypothetical protein